MTRKHFIRFAGAALAGVVALACAREAAEPSEPVESGREREVTFHAMEIKSKAQFGDKDGNVWPTLWTNNDSKVKLSLNYGSSMEADVTPSEDWRSATFSATVDFSGVSGPYTYYSVSPSSVAKALSPSREAWKVSIPSVQSPSAGSPDESALIIASTSSTYATVDDASDVNLYFQHLTAYGCISITGLDLDGKTVQALEITATEPFVGDWYWKCDTHELTDYGASSTLTINTSSASDVWFGCAPVDMSDQIWVVSLITDAGTYRKEVLLDGTYELQAGVVAVISVDMSTDTDFIQAGSGSGGSGGNGPFTLVTDDSTLSAGDEVLIVYKAGSKALGASSGNFRSSVAVSISENAISDPGDATVLTLFAGSSSGTFAFYDGEHYLSSPTSGSNNYLLSTLTSVNANASWSISINSSGLASVTAQAGTRTLLKYNSSSPRFSCYASGQNDVSIFRRSGGSGSGVSASDPMLEHSVYGCWLGTGLEWEYNPGTDQITRSYDSNGVQTYTLIKASVVEELEISGYKKSYVKGDSVTLTVYWHRGTTLVLSDSYQMTLIKEDGPKVWLSDGNGKGFVIKK
jgi:hypothetical protein